MKELIGFLVKLGQGQTGQKIGHAMPVANMEGAQYVHEAKLIWVSPTCRVAGRKEEERIVSLKVRGGGGRGCNTMCSGNDGGSQWLDGARMISRWRH